jgi:hypothetical protein
MDLQSLLAWTETLTGLAPDRTGAARDVIASWGYPRLTSELVADSIDSVVAATLLIDAVERLEQAGVDRARLLKKLRQDPEVWGTWAEFRAADSILRTFARDAELRIEEGKSAGAHADLRFVRPDEAMTIEVKAIGLSDTEVAFCQRMAPALDKMLPTEGLGHLHTSITAQPPVLPREVRRELDRQARSRVKRLRHLWPRGLRGAVIVGHGSEQAYANRVGRRVAQAVRQLPTSDPCWVAIYWSNGAPFETVARSIPWEGIPEHVLGIILVGGGVSWPDARVHFFVTALGRDAPAEADLELDSVEPEPEMKELAGLVLGVFERSSGVRPTLLAAGDEILIRRDGSRRILPFNLLMDSDRLGFDRQSEDFPWS